jgi:hypothetical protein
MNNYGEYASLINKALSEQGEEMSEARNVFTEKLAEVQEVKGLIEKTGDLLAPLGFAAPGVKRAGKILKMRYDRRFKNKNNNTEEETQTADAPEEGGTELQTMSSEGEPRLDPLNAQDSAFNLDPEENILGGQLDQSRQQPQEEQQQQPQQADDEPAPEDASTADPAPAAGDAAPAPAPAADPAPAAADPAPIGDVVAPDITADLTADSALLADPFTFIFGLIFGGAILAGTLGGAASIKNPSVPKVPALSNVATQFGVGS